MPTIYLPAGTTHVLCDDVALKIADALWPDDGIDDEGWSVSFGLCWGETESEIMQAVKSGMLPVKKSLTFAPLTFLHGSAWKSGVVTIDDLRAYVADRGITVVVGEAPEQADTQPQAGNDAPVVEVPAKRRTLWDVVTPYIIQTMQSGQYASAKQLFKALETKAGQGSPFDKGSDSNRYSLFVREICEPLAVKTLQNNWRRLRIEAAKK